MLPAATFEAVQTMVRVGSDSVWAEDSGGGGPLLVLLHEGIGDSRMWDPLWPQLTAAARVIRYDVRGFGRSPAATENFALLGDLRTILDHFGVASAHFAGCSMGGGTALELALAKPDRVLSMVLLCPGIGGYPYPDEPELAAEYAALTAACDEDGLVRLGMREWGAAGPSPFAEDLMRSAVRAGPSEQFMLQGEPVFGKLAEVRVPCVLMVGDLDRGTLIASNEEAARRIPGCQLIIMPGVDHYPTVRKPELITETILGRLTAGC
jgi:3-oxoadipate enol-lactonase